MGFQLMTFATPVQCYDQMSYQAKFVLHLWMQAINECEYTSDNHIYEVRMK